MLAVAALVLSACRIEVVAELDLEAGGGGAAVLELFLDREVLGIMDELAVDAVDEVKAAAAVTDGWDLEVLAEGADGLRLRLEHQGPDPAGALRELSAGLADHDPGLLVDLEVQRARHEGRPDEVSLAGDALLRAPAAPGVIDRDGGELGPDPHTLEALTREHVDGRLLVTMPGALQEHDASEVDDGRLAWDLPVGERVPIAAASELTALPLPRAALLAIGLALLATVAGIVVWAVRRRA